MYAKSTELRVSWEDCVKDVILCMTGVVSLVKIEGEDGKMENRIKRYETKYIKRVSLKIW